MKKDRIRAEQIRTVSTDDTPLYNSRVISTYIRYVKNYYSYINIGDLLEHAGMELYQVEDEDQWFTQEQINRFHEILAKLTSNKNVAREAGRYAASPDIWGSWRSYILGFVKPATVYEMIGRAASNVVRSSVYEARRIGSNQVEIIVTPKPGVREEPFQCENRMGYFEAIAAIFNYKLPIIEHTECIFEGGTCCRYAITWQELRSAMWKKIRNWTFLPLAVICLGLYLYAPPVVWDVFICLSLLTMFLLTNHASKVERDELTTALDNLRASIDVLFEKIDANYNNARMINEIGQALSRQRDIEGILSQVVQVLEKRLDYDRGMILLADKEKVRLDFRVGFGHREDQLAVLQNTSFHLDRPESRGVLVASFHEQKPFLINNVDEIESELSPRSVQWVRTMGAKSFICCPIIYVDECIGVLVVDNLKTKRPLLQSDLDLLMGIIPEIGISIHNAMVTEAKERQFHSILQVLASSIDARDPLTSGHSERVTEYAVGIARELTLPKEYCEMIRVASLLHDYGKIGIEDGILKKQGELTAAEYEQIKTHTTKTRQILDKIEFEGIYKEVPQVTESHHEKYDGTGYPRHLHGEEIPLGARILAVADVFEAITSKRHYRDPMPLEDAFQLLRKNKDLHFDAKVVDAFFRYYRKREKNF